MARYSEFVKKTLAKLRYLAGEASLYKVEKKLWGAAVQVQYSEDHQTSIAILNAGGHSSIHYHKKKVNHFYCLEGHAKILLWDGDPNSVKFRLPPDCQLTLNQENEAAIIKTWQVHQMFAIEDTVLVENYYPTTLGSKVCLKDIYRLNEGGIVK